MKRFLPLFMLTGLLFGQDVLLHKSGEVYKGKYIGKVDEDIVFQIEERPSTNNFPINDVDIVITNRGGIKVEYYYPFDIPIDIPTKKEGNDLARIAMQGNDLARIAMQFLFNPNPTPLQFCGGVIAWGIVFIILLALNPGSDS